MLYFGAEVTGKYALTQHLTAIFFIDLDQLAGDAADNPRVSLKGSPEQFIAGLGLSYKVAVEP